MATYPMTDEQWYETLYQLDEELDRAQLDASTAFLQWSRNPQGQIPPPANVDGLQTSRSRHMLFAPNDEIEDEVLERLTAERFAQDHVESMGHIKPYALSVRHTQTRQYHDGLMNNAELLLNESKAIGRWTANMASSLSQSSDQSARNRMAAALAAYQEANSDEDMHATEADRDRIFGVSKADVKKETEKELVESVEEDKAHSLLKEDSSSLKDVKME